MNWGQTGQISCNCCGLRSCYWAGKNAKFVKALLTTLVNEDVLPSDLDVRGWLFLDVERLIVSDVKRQSLLATFHEDESLTGNEALYEEDPVRIPDLLFTVVKQVLLVPGVRDDLSFVLGVFSPTCLSSFDETDLLAQKCAISQVFLWK